MPKANEIGPAEANSGDRQTAQRAHYFRRTVGGTAAAALCDCNYGRPSEDTAPIATLRRRRISRRRRSGDQSALAIFGDEWATVELAVGSSERQHHCEHS